MNPSDLLKDLKLDHWYKVVLILGATVLVASFFIEVKGITNSQLQLLAGGMFLIGLGEWQNHGDHTEIWPPNIYTGGSALQVTTHVRKPTLFGLFLDIVGAILLAVFVWKIITTPPTQAQPGGMITATPTITMTETATATIPTQTPVILVVTATANATATP